MSFLSKLFGKSKVAPIAETLQSSQQEVLVPVPIPALSYLLLQFEKQKGSTLSEAEVIEVRDKAVCIMLPVSKKHVMDEKRGYKDINPENVWPEWQAFRKVTLSG
jgi:hypothetical protein